MTATKPKLSPKEKLRLSPQEAADLLSITREVIYLLVKDGTLSARSNKGQRGTGVRIYFDTKEIEAFAAGGAEGAQSYREQRDTAGKKIRGRGGRVGGHK